jgi:uncharacterized protein
VIVSRRRLEERNQRQAAQIDGLIADRDAWKTDADATGRALGQVASELSRAKDVIALHLVAAGHPSTVLHDAKTFADALQQALTDAGVDLQIELARLEGTHL